MSGKVTNVWWGMGFFLPAHPVFPIQQSRLFSWQSKGSGWRVLWPAVSIAIVWTWNYNVLVCLIQDEKTGKKNSYDTSPKRAYSAISFFYLLFCLNLCQDLCRQTNSPRNIEKNYLWMCFCVCVCAHACLRVHAGHGIFSWLGHESLIRKISPKPIDHWRAKGHTYFRTSSRHFFLFPALNFPTFRGVGHPTAESTWGNWLLVSGLRHQCSEHSTMLIPTTLKD